MTAVHDKTNTTDTALSSEELAKLATAQLNSRAVTSKGIPIELDPNQRVSMDKASLETNEKLKELAKTDIIWGVIDRAHDDFSNQLKQLSKQINEQFSDDNVIALRTELAQNIKQITGSLRSIEATRNSIQGKATKEQVSHLRQQIEALNHSKAFIHFSDLSPALALTISTIQEKIIQITQQLSQESTNINWPPIDNTYEQLSQQLNELFAQAAKQFNKKNIDVLHENLRVEATALSAHFESISNSRMGKETAWEAISPAYDKLSQQLEELLQKANEQFKEENDDEVKELLRTIEQQATKLSANVESIKVTQKNKEIAWGTISSAYDDLSRQLETLFQKADKQIKKHNMQRLQSEIEQQTAELSKHFETIKKTRSSLETTPEYKLTVLSEQIKKLSHSEALKQVSSLSPELGLAASTIREHLKLISNSCTLSIKMHQITVAREVELLRQKITLIKSKDAKTTEVNALEKRLEHILNSSTNPVLLEMSYDTQISKLISELNDLKKAMNLDNEDVRRTREKENSQEALHELNEVYNSSVALVQLWRDKQYRASAANLIRIHENMKRQFLQPSLKLEGIARIRNSIIKEDKIITEASLNDEFKKKATKNNAVKLVNEMKASLQIAKAKLHLEECKSAQTYLQNSASAFSIAKMIEMKKELSQQLEAFKATLTRSPSLNAHLVENYIEKTLTPIQKKLQQATPIDEVPSITVNDIEEALRILDETVNPTKETKQNEINKAKKNLQSKVFTYEQLHFEKQAYRKAHEDFKTAAQTAVTLTNVDSAQDTLQPLLLSWSQFAEKTYIDALKGKTSSTTAPKKGRNEEKSPTLSQKILIALNAVEKEVENKASIYSRSLQAQKEQYSDLYVTGKSPALRRKSTTSQAEADDKSGLEKKYNNPLQIESLTQDVYRQKLENAMMEAEDFLESMRNMHAQHTGITELDQSIKRILDSSKSEKEKANLIQRLRSASAHILNVIDQEQEHLLASGSNRDLSRMPLPANASETPTTPDRKQRILHMLSHVKIPKLITMEHLIRGTTKNVSYEKATLESQVLIKLVRKFCLHALQNPDVNLKDLPSFEGHISAIEATILRNWGEKNNLF